MDYIITLQCFRDSASKPVIKEAAVLCVDKNYIAHFICSPPYAFTDLPIKIQEYNNWISSTISGIEWFEGSVPHRQLYAILRDIVKTARTIYSYEESCVKLLESITTRNIVNLSNIGYVPTVKTPNNRKVFCYHHGSLQREIFSCALTIAGDIQNWLLLRSENNGINDNKKSRLAQEEEEDLFAKSLNSDNVQITQSRAKDPLDIRNLENITNVNCLAASTLSEQNGYFTDIGLFDKIEYPLVRSISS